MTQLELARAKHNYAILREGEWTPLYAPPGGPGLLAALTDGLLSRSQNERPTGYALVYKQTALQLHTAMAIYHDLSEASLMCSNCVTRNNPTEKQKPTCKGCTHNQMMRFTTSQVFLQNHQGTIYLSQIVRSDKHKRRYVKVVGQ